MSRTAAQSQEVFNVDINSTNSRDDAQQVLDAMRQIQESPELQAEAQTNPEGVMDRLGLSGIARHAVAFGIAGLVVAHTVVKPAGFWN